MTRGEQWAVAPGTGDRAGIADTLRGQYETKPA